MRKTNTIHPNYQQPTRAMNLTYKTILNTSGEGYSTRLSYGEDFTQAELNAAVAAAHSVTPEQAEAIGREYFAILMAAATPRRCLNLFGLMSVQPTSGGSSPLPDGFHNATDINAGWAITMLADVLRDWRETCTIEKVGDEGAAAPVMESVINEADGVLNTYTSSQLVHILGDRLAFDKTDLTQGVFFDTVPPSTPIRAEVFGPIGDKNVYAAVPGGILAGPLKVILTNNRGHTSTYTTTITQTV
jgi:hypothetical protein